jgi:hypothetical protein
MLAHRRRRFEVAGVIRALATASLIVAGCSSQGASQGSASPSIPQGNASSSASQGTAASVTPEASGPDLPQSATSDLHLYVVRLPSGWTTSLATTVDARDTFSGTEGELTVGVSAIPAGASTSDWPDIYLDERVADFPAGCLARGAAAREATQLGAEQGWLVALPCESGWILVAPHEDRLYDLRFKDASGGPSAPRKALFQAIAGRFTFTPGTLATSPPTASPAAS